MDVAGACTGVDDDDDDDVAAGGAVTINSLTSNTLSERVHSSVYLQFYALHCSVVMICTDSYLERVILTLRLSLTC